jgi:hypothetical protein
MWHQFHDVENKDDQDYQIALWQKAYRLQPEQAFKLAQQNNITDEVGDALKVGDAEQYEEWKARGK